MGQGDRYLVPLLLGVFGYAFIKLSWEIAKFLIKF
ncbi:hypothetical protein N752_21135 [Desulforamulus aquiferis]|nr:hypothetical protein N752_21135 [Desulforamulus aquiferis]